jgi:hypothetical protein
LKAGLRAESNTKIGFKDSRIPGVKGFRFQAFHLTGRLLASDVFIAKRSRFQLIKVTLPGSV